MAVEPATPFAIPNTDDATPCEFDGQILLIIDIVFPVQTSEKKTIKKRDEIDIQKLIGTRKHVGTKIHAIKAPTPDM